MQGLGKQRVITENTIVKMDKEGIVHMSFQEGAYIDLDESKKILSIRENGYHSLAINNFYLWI